MCCVETEDPVDTVTNIGNRMCVVAGSVVEYLVDKEVQGSAFAFRGYGEVRSRYCFIMCMLEVRRIKLGVRRLVQSNVCRGSCVEPIC